MQKSFSSASAATAVIYFSAMKQELYKEFKTADEHGWTQIKLHLIPI
jgi:hypothetical protein